MNDILNKKYGDVFSKNIMHDIQHLMTQHDVEDIHCKIKNALAINEFSDAVINMIDEHIQNNKNLDENEFIIQTYKAIAECFIYREDYESKHVDGEKNELILKLQHWICNNCGNCNVNAYIDNRFTTNIAVCTLCGMHQRDQIILKLRNHDSYIMVNDVNMKRYEMNIDDDNEAKDKFIDKMIINAIKADGAFNLLCPHKNSQDSCISVLRLAKRLIQYKRWLHTIHKKKGGQDANKTVNVDIAKYIDNNIYKRIFVDVVNNMELIKENEMESIIEFIQTQSHHLLNADLFLEKNIKNKTTFSEILQSHIKLSESCVNKLYNLVSKALKKTDKMDEETLKRILIEKLQFIHKQTELLIKMFEGNADNIADIKLFTRIKPLKFAKIIRANTEIDIPTGSRLYKGIKEPLKQSAQTQQFGQFLCDLDLEMIRKDYHHILQMHIENGNKESIKNVFRFFQKIVHYNDTDNECRSITRKKERSQKTDTGTDEDHDTANGSNDIWELKQYYMQSQLDIIHCHLVHCNVQRALKRHTYDHNDAINDEKYVEEYNDDSPQNGKFVTELSESDTTNYGFGINHEHPYLKPVYDSIHDELLLNKLSYRFSITQWQNTLVKAIKKCHLLLHETHDLKCKYYQKQYNIIRNECIGLRHLCALCIYADSTKFCTMFRKTYRKFKNESINNVISRHKQLYYYAKSLYESIEFFGKRMSPKLKVYHGLDRILFFSKFTAYFNQPISTSLDINIANSFSRGSGIILTLRAAANLFAKHKTPKYLSISWLSSFPHESEYLFYGQYVVFNICNIHNIECENNENENKKRTYLKEHSSELLLLNEFQKIISNEHVTYKWTKDSQKILLLVELINKYHNDTSTTRTGYISEFGSELFNYFCQNQRQIWIYNFVKLPTLLRNALLLHTDHYQSQKYEAYISFVRITQLFINVQEIVLNGLDIKQMTAAAEDYIKSVLKYTQKSKETQTNNLKTIIFKSKSQNDNKPNATLQNVTTKYMNTFIQNDWELYYTLSVDKTHNIVFRMRVSISYDNVSVQARNKRRSTVFASSKWTHLPSYFMQVTYVDEDSFHLVVLADAKSNKSRKLFIKDVDQLKYKRLIKIKKGKISVEIDMEIDKREKYRFGLYDSDQSLKPIVHSTKASLTVLKDESRMPPNNARYKPQCIDLRTVFQVEDKKNKQINIYWSLPQNSFGNISYKIIGDTVPLIQYIISSLPYTIQLSSIQSQNNTFRVITIAEIEETETVYESDISEPIAIEYKHAADSSEQPSSEYRQSVGLPLSHTDNIIEEVVVEASEMRNLNIKHWTQLFRGESSIYAVDEASKEWVDRGISGELTMYQNNQYTFDIRIKWRKNHGEQWWRLINGKLQPKDESALVLKAYDETNRKQEILAIRFPDAHLCERFAKKLYQIFPPQNVQPNMSPIMNVVQPNYFQQPPPPPPPLPHQGYFKFNQPNYNGENMMPMNAMGGNMMGMNSMMPLNNIPIIYNSRPQQAAAHNSGKTWQCASCTYFNEASRASCIMCGLSTTKSKKPTYEAKGQQHEQRLASQPHVRNSWTCTLCTLHNSNTVTRCAACNNRNGNNSNNNGGNNNNKEPHVPPPTAPPMMQHPGGTRGGDDDDSFVLQQIIIWSTHENMRDNDTMETLLLTHVQFTTSLNLLKNLRCRFSVPIPQDIRNDDKIAEFRLNVEKRIQLKVIKSLIDWMKSYWDDDFLNDLEVQKELTQWLGEIEEQKSEDCPWIASISKMVRTEYESFRSKSPNQDKRLKQELISKPDADTGVPAVLQDVQIKKGYKISNSTADDLADAITLMDYKIFSNIDRRECIGQAWKKNKKQSPNVLRMIQQFNNLHVFVQLQILGEKTLKHRAKMIKRIIKMGERFKELKNYNSLCAILGALNGSPIHRLKAAWQRVPEKQLNQFEQFRQIFLDTRNFRNFRQLFRTISPPAIPYFGLFLQDLVFIDDGQDQFKQIDNFKEHGNMVNFYKYIRTMDRIKSIRLYQTNKYIPGQHLKEQQFLQKILYQEFHKMKEFTEDKIWDISTQVKKADEGK